MKAFLAICAILALFLSTPARACELSSSVGKQLTGQSERFGLGSGIASIGCRWDHKIDLQLTWVGENQLYNGALVIPAFPILSVGRVWEFKHRWFGRPGTLAGLSFKESQRCQFNGDSNCNRKMPLPIAFHWGAEIAWTDWRLQVFHDSNDDLDHGPEHKNMGLNWATITYRFR